MSKHRMIQLYEIHEQEKLKCDDKRQIIGYLIDHQWLEDLSSEFFLTCLPPYNFLQQVL